MSSVAAIDLLLLLPLQMRVYDDGSEESKHRKEEIAALGASNPTAVYRCARKSVHMRCQLSSGLFAEWQARPQRCCNRHIASTRRNS